VGEVSAEELERLLVVQEHDLALDRLRHRRDTLPERRQLADARAALTAIAAELTELEARRNTVRAEERRLDDEAEALGERAAEVDQRLYSGTVTSPRELQAMQADVDMLKRHRSELEDHELEVMEEREALDDQITAREGIRKQHQDEEQQLAAAISTAEAEIDAERAVEQSARDENAAGIRDVLIRDYEKRRARNRGAGAARLVGATCQACHLTIPSTEAERIRRSAGDEVAYCDNCGAILVP
jgi:predicted  nucleic acid-binding Zn-ribbon protein